MQQSYQNRSRFPTSHLSGWKGSATSSDQFCRHSSSDAGSLFPCTQPCTPHMKAVADRLNTYQGWPNHIKATKSELAEAGFLYLGTADRVKCFYCNGGLQNWKFYEDPWFEHAKWYPNCEYLLRYKGIQYTQHIASQFPKLNRPTVQNPEPYNSYLDLMPHAPATATLREVESETSIPSTSTSKSSQSSTVKLDVALKGEVVMETAAFGFDMSMIRKVVKRKLESENAEYKTVKTLVEDLQTEEMQAGAASSEANECMDTGICLTASNSIKRETKAVQDTILENSATNSKKPLTKVFPKKAKPCNPVENQSLSETFDFNNVEERVRTLTEQITCKVCLDRKSNCIFIPCSHLCCCVECAASLRKCPLCRSHVDKIIKIYRA